MGGCPSGPSVPGRAGPAPQQRGGTAASPAPPARHRA
jgi:hypothetical protein